jgi:phenylalanyl-tRNA synthetase alpha chain
MSLQEKLKSLLETARGELAAVAEAAGAEALRVKYLGKKGELSGALSSMGKLPPEERRALGEVANKVKAELEQLVAEALARAEEARLQADLQGPGIDITLPGRGHAPGRRHPVSQTLDDMVQIFARLGFDVATGPEIEFDWHNFAALNFPPDHPARDAQDTFWVELPGAREANPVVLRTHTSPVQIRTMLSQKPPVRVVVPGRVYRRDSDITHTPMFHQIEGLLVDARVTFADLKGTLDAFAKAFYGASVKTRFRPSFFPFTEPSAEMDVSCAACGGKGCRICKGTGWLEVLGSGMVHPNVFTACGYDPAKVTGFAFGCGVERIAMLRYGVDDLRSFFEGDVRFMEQF